MEATVTMLRHSLSSVVDKVLDCVYVRPSRGRHERIEYDDSLISRMPDWVLHEILSKLPFKDVVRTSTLSHRWRSLWKEGDRLNLQIEGDSRVYSSVLSKLWVGKLKTLRIDFERPLEANQDEIEKLISFGKRKCIDNLYIVGGYNIPDSVFSIPTLKRLELEALGNRLPLSIEMPRLKTISLKGMWLDKSNLTALISNSPALKNLSIIDWISRDRLAISGSATLKKLRIVCSKGWPPADDVDIADLPSLEYLELEGPQGAWSSLNNLPPLVEVYRRLY